MTILSNDKKVGSGGNSGTNSGSNGENPPAPSVQLQSASPSSLGQASVDHPLPAIRRVQNLDNHLSARPVGHRPEQNKKNKRQSQYRNGTVNSENLPKKRRQDEDSSPSVSTSSLQSAQPCSPILLNLTTNTEAVPSLSGSSFPASTTTVRSDPAQDDNNCNSEDEYESRPQASEFELKEREYRFERRMNNKGFIIKPMKEDGACLFRAVADQVYGDQDGHAVVRKQCMDYIAKNRDYFSQYITEDFTSYVNRKRGETVHGNHIEIQALSEIYNRTIQVFCYSPEPINTFHGASQTDNEPIRLSYHNGVHYNSIVDPNKATVGVGLGLPGHVPGLAEHNLMQEATKQSENLLIEQAMLEDKLLASDWEATDDVLTEQVARESYMQWLQANERRSKRSPSPSTSAKAMCLDKRNSPKRRSQATATVTLNLNEAGSPKNSPKYSGPSALRSRPSSPEEKKDGFRFSPARSPSIIPNLPPELFGLNEWDDPDGIMAKVLASSQQEYLDGLKKPKADDTDSLKN